MFSKNECPGCGLDLDKLLITTTSSKISCPSCGTDITKQIVVLDFRDVKEPESGQEQYLESKELDQVTSFETFYNRAVGISFQYPKGWICETKESNVTFRPSDVVGLRVPGETGLIYEVAGNLVVGNKGELEKDRTGFYNEFLMTQETNLQGYDVKQETITLSNGEIALTYSMNFMKKQYPFRTIGIFAAREKNVFLLDVSGIMSKVEPLEKVCHKIVRSLSF